VSEFCRSIIIRSAFDYFAEIFIFLKGNQGVKHKEFVFEEVGSVE